jgi:hypothetical protein
MQFALYVVLPVLFITVALTAAMVWGDGSGASGIAGLSWAAFPKMCGF